MLTQKRLKNVLKYTHKTGIWVWKNPTSTKIKAGAIAGTITKRGYRKIRIDGTKYRSGRLVWLYVYGVWPVYEIDHKNRIRDDDRFINLREATRFGNIVNKGLLKNNKSGFTGVYFDKRIKRWCAQIEKKRKTYYLGSFTFITDAISARREAEIKFGFRVHSECN